MSQKKISKGYLLISVPTIKQLCPLGQLHCQIFSSSPADKKKKNEVKSNTLVKLFRKVYTLECQVRLTSGNASGDSSDCLKLKQAR